MKSEDTKAMASLKWSTAELKQVSPNSPCLLNFKYVVYIQQQKFSFAQVTLTLSSSYEVYITPVEISPRAVNFPSPLHHMEYVYAFNPVLSDLDWERNFWITQ